MKRALLLTLLLLAPAGASAQAERAPVKMDLQLIYIFEAEKPEYVFVLGQAGFKSVASLENYLESWPRGSELRWAPGCKRMGGEPILSSDEEMDAFRKFLSDRGINFVLVPSG